jgi:hypothetical protein
VCNQFLVAEHQNPDWSQGILIHWMREEWRGILSTIQRYITGEGRFSIVHCYHLIFLMHLNGDKEMNLPFYLLKILTKMSKRVQNYPQTSHRSLYHQGFIKILVLFALSELGMSWEEILVSLGLQDEEPKNRKLNNNHQNRKLKFPRKLGFPQSLEVHQKPPNIPKKRPTYKKKDQIRQRKIHHSRKRRNTSEAIEVIHSETEGQRRVIKYYVRKGKK